MSNQVQPQVVRSYLRELEVALAGVPEAERRAVLEGATEELSGLDAVAAAARIEELGDPEFIAVEARAESGAGSVGSSGSTAVSGGSSNWYIVVASLLVALGGAVIPVLGWIAGIVMVWMSKTWRTWEEWVATLTAPALTWLVVIIPYWLFASPTAVPTVDGEALNPLAPALYDLLWTGLLFFTAVNVVVGLWLLVRGLRRNDAPFR